MRQQVVVVAAKQDRKKLEPAFADAAGAEVSHFSKRGPLVSMLKRSRPELLVLVDPVPGGDTRALWQELTADLEPEDWPTTVILAERALLADFEDLAEAGAQLVDKALKTEALRETLGVFLRHAPRPEARVMVKVGVEVGAGKVLRMAQTANVSRSGLLIRTREFFPPGATLDLKLELPGDDVAVEAKGEVVRLTVPAVEGIQGLGIRFVSFRGRDDERFDKFMKSTESRAAKA